MGRGWMRGLGILLRNVMNVKAIASVEGLVAEYASVFDGALGTFKGVSAKITIEDNVKPWFFKPRSVPFTMIYRVNEELMHMGRVGVLRTELVYWFHRIGLALPPHRSESADKFSSPKKDCGSSLLVAAGACYMASVLF
ncbi:hypothetical protein MRX96_011344 [Rhipicephalus microplus]